MTRRGKGAPPALHAGQRYGRWTLVSRLGTGGNGEVWRANDASGQKVALKFLTKTGDVAYQRFRREVRALTAARRLKGVLPILDHELPASAKASSPPWFAMPIAMPIAEAVGFGGLAGVVDAVRSLARTLARLHDRGICHRDIKLDNLYLYDTWCLGDFGLVDFPDVEEVTRRGEQVGPKWTIAPEMRRDAANADGRCADVYSLAKVLWILVTRSLKGFEGQYLPASRAIGLRRYLREDEHVLALDELLERATDHMPANRPTMRAFHAALRDWEKTVSSPHSRSLSSWATLLKRLFPQARPRRVEWMRLQDIGAVLQQIAALPDGSCIFSPRGAKLDLQAVLPARETACIEVQATGREWFADDSPAVVRPERLTFESVGDWEEWSYFRLDLGELAPTKVGDDATPCVTEELVELPTGGYVPYDTLLGPRRAALLGEGRRVSRYLRGSFVIFAERSPYGLAAATSDGRHDGMSADAFRDYVRACAEKYLAAKARGAHATKETRRRTPSRAHRGTT